MPSSSDDAAGENATGSDAATDHDARDDATDHDARDDATDHDASAATASDVGAAEAALSAAIEAADGDPTCALCPKPADYFLYESDHVEKFVCWEHVSPHSAAVDGEDARPGRPLALSL